MSFPLYERLSKNVINKELTLKEKNYFLESIKNIDTNGSELIYVLIKFHSINNDLYLNNIPFDGEQKHINNNCYDISWSLSKLPNKLKQILLNFLKMHVINMKEEKQRNLANFQE
tara:strand:- start:1919 stop:2263 length:345 start_codon:yes stop_codon:yes gene_type:complete